MPHYVILSPLDSPLAYLSFAISWLSSAICIAVSIYFYRRKLGPWWLLVAAAFAIPLIVIVIWSLSHGLPPLPHGSEEPQHVTHTLTGATIIIKGIKSNINLSPIEPLMAIALAWAYFADRRQGQDGV